MQRDFWWSLLEFLLTTMSLQGNMNPKKVYILGAGSSIGHSEGAFPTINDFFARAYPFIKNGDEFSTLALYIKENFAKDMLDEDCRLNIEDVLTHIEIEIERNPSIQGDNLRRQLLGIIDATLRRLEAEYKLSGKRGEYHDFAGQISDRDNRDSIITFNWDLLLDNALGREPILKGVLIEETRGLLKEHYWNFISHFSGYGEQLVDGIQIKSPYRFWDKEGQHLKLHGSIDWFYCSNEGCRCFEKLFPIYGEDNRLYNCGECHGKLEMLIIPPVLNKVYGKYPVINRMWNFAAKEISHADELIIWGYSLPATDFYASWLLRQARKGPLRKLAIINPDVVSKNGERLKREFVDKFYNLYRGKVPENEILLFESFEDYNNCKTVMEKYFIKL